MKPAVQRRVLRYALGALLLLTTSLPCSGEESALWGKAGEKWSPQSRLPDFSFAGYHAGADPLPKVKQVADVRTFGATGDGETDDTAALQKAIHETQAGAILLPAGEYVLTRPLQMKSGVVLRGEGMGKTVLVIPKSLQEIQPKKLSSLKKLSYSFGGSFVRFQGRDKGKRIASLLKDATRGADRLALSEVGGVRAGDTVRLVVRSHPELGRALHAGLASAGKDTLTKKKRKFLDWAVRVLAVDTASKEIQIDRPLRLDIKVAWQPALFAYQPTLQEAGIENLSFRFAGRKKKRHLQEEGFNAIEFRGAVNCWATGIEFIDCDLGLKADRSARNCQASELVFRAEKRSAKRTGHHGLWASGLAQDCLFEKFDFRTRFIHDLTVEGFASGNVFRNGKGIQLNFDHHRNAPYENLFSNLDVGNPGRIYSSSGRGDRGPHSGARTTLWNIRASQEDSPFPAPPTDPRHWPQINLIGTGDQLAALVEREDPETSRSAAHARLPWIEPLVGGVEPKELSLSQLQRRLGRVVRRAAAESSPGD